MSMNRGMLTYIPVYPDFEVLPSHDENTGGPYGLTQKMSRTGCLKSWLQGNTQSAIPFLKTKTRTPAGCVCVCFQGHELAGQRLAGHTPNYGGHLAGFRVRCGEIIIRNTPFLLYILLCLISLFTRTCCSSIKIILEEENEINILVNIFITTGNCKARIKIR